MTWLERAVAIDASSEDVWKVLRAAYVATGQKAKARRVDDHLAGRSRFHLAACVSAGGASPRAILLGAYQPGVGFIPLHLSGETPPPEKVAELETLGRALATENWFGVGTGAPLVGTPFARPEISESSSAGGTTRVLALGPCDDEVPKERTPKIFATLPLAPIAESADFDWSNAGKLVGALREVGAVQEVVGLRVSAFAAPARRRDDHGGRSAAL